IITQSHLYSTPYNFSFTTPPPPPISTLSLHDALPISHHTGARHSRRGPGQSGCQLRSGQLDSLRQSQSGGRHRTGFAVENQVGRSEEHTSELQSLRHLVCRLLLEKKKKIKTKLIYV